MKTIVNLVGEEVATKLITAPIPTPAAHQVLIKIVVSGSNPKDWKVPVFQSNGFLPVQEGDGTNQGDDIAGIIESVGPEVLEFKPGDRVASFHEMQSPGGSYAEYGLGWDHSTFHLPDSISFEEAATIPLAALTATVALYQNLKLPTPWTPATESIPFVLYGASTAVGAFAIKLLQNSNIHPIIAIAGKSQQYVETLLDRSKGDAVFDYRHGSDEVIRQIQEHLKAGGFSQPRYGIDPGIGKSSQQVLTTIVAKDGNINLVLPSDTDAGTANKTITSVGVVHNQENGKYGADGSDLGLAACRWFTRALQRGSFEGHPYEVRPGGLEAVEQALKDLKDGKNSAVKYVFRIADTPGL
ncbi:chaperonin 10-like protein [Paraphoma chrysanthemicola]|nr:chaperonin 10-like protein [Paraphoma chrysanthemicola]